MSENPAEYESLTLEQVEDIQRAFSGIDGMIARVRDINVDSGAGVIDDHTKCVWTHDGHRITLWVSTDGGRGASCSKAIDPLWDTRQR